MRYQSGVCLSTNLGRALPVAIHRISRVRHSFGCSPNVEGDEAGARRLSLAGPTPIRTSPSPISSATSADPETSAINPAPFGPRINFEIQTHYIGDPGYAGRDGMSLAFEYNGEFRRRQIS